jgi:release factor glutamine methyltransferase
MSTTMSGLVGRLRAAGCVFAEEEAALLHEAARSPEELEQLVGRRVVGEPLEQVVGWASFRGVRVLVEPGVFVPRRRTELLAALAVDAARPGADVVDLCCGSGAVGAVVQREVPGVRVYAADLDPVAVRCARRNLPREQVFEGDLYAALPGGLRGCVDVLAVNAPYVPSDAVGLMMPPEARDHEALIALDGGPDGLDVHRRVVAGAGEWLRGGGRLLLEASRVQAPVTERLMRKAGLATEVVNDEDRDATVVVGRTGRVTGPAVS